MPRRLALESPGRTLLPTATWSLKPRKLAATLLMSSGSVDAPLRRMSSCVSIRTGKADCSVLDTTSRWFGVTYPDDKQHVVASIRKLIETGEYPADLSQAAVHA